MVLLDREANLKIQNKNKRQGHQEENIELTFQTLKYNFPISIIHIMITVLRN